MPRQHALRTGRISLRGQRYVVTSVTDGRLPLFRDFTMGRLVISALKNLDKDGTTITWAFVVMPDHFHWLVELASQPTLSEVVRRMKGSSARAINRVRNCRGPVWQQGFHDRAVRDDQDLKAVARYVIANPVRAGIVTTVRNYSLWDARWLRG